MAKRNRNLNNILVTGAGTAAGLATSKIAGAMVPLGTPTVKSLTKVGIGAGVAYYSGKNNFGVGLGSGWIANGVDQFIASLGVYNSGGGGNGSGSNDRVQGDNPGRNRRVSGENPGPDNRLS